MTITFTPIGIIHTPFHEPAGTPRQSAFAGHAAGTVEVYPALAEGLADLEGFSHILLLYHFHKSSGYALRCTPFADSAERGLFATRAPRRPNPIGISVVRLLGRRDNILAIEGVDMLDGTPLLDIKPYISDFDSWRGVRNGWHEHAPHRDRATADNRFTTPDTGKGEGNADL